MVQVIRTEDPRGRMAEMLGMSLGQGLGNGLNTYFANRSLDSVLHDKALEGAPTSKKLEAMRSALSPYGEKGQEILQQRMQIEQQEMQERETEKQEKLTRLKGRAIGKFQKGEELSDEEWARFTPQEVAALQNIGIQGRKVAAKEREVAGKEREAERTEESQRQRGRSIAKYQKGEPLSDEEWAAFTPSEVASLQRAYHPTPPGGLTGQSTPPEVSNAINRVLDNSEGMSSDELNNAMDQAGIPRIYSNSYVENRRRTQDTGTEHDIKFHQESANFEKEVSDHAKTARRQLPLIDKSIKAVSEGKINPSSLANVFTFFGERGKKISNALLSKDESALISSIPEFLEGRKELFGVRLSDADLRLLQDKLPDIGKNKEANLSVLDLMKKSADRALKIEKISQDVLEKKDCLIAVENFDLQDSKEK